MLNPGSRVLINRAVTIAVAGEAQTAFDDLAGILSALLVADFRYGSGGATCKCWVQISVDAGASWIDVANFAFTTASAIKVINLSALTPILTAFTPSDGAMADDTYQDGALSAIMRAKITTTGTYGGTTIMTVRLDAK